MSVDWQRFELEMWETAETAAQQDEDQWKARHPWLAVLAIPLICLALWAIPAAVAVLVWWAVTR